MPTGSGGPPGTRARPARRPFLWVAAAGTVLVTALVTAAVGQYPLARRPPEAIALAGEPPVRVIDHGPLPPEVRESSGLAVSRTHPGIFWTLNDSGDEPRVYALDADAALVAAIEVAGASAEDWEALDLGRCPLGWNGAVWCLYAADIGDNAGRRESVAVWVVPEPDPHGPEPRAGALGSVRFRYEGGRFDAEALAVTPEGDVVIATKGREPSVLAFRIAAAEVARALRSGEVLTLTAPITLPIRPDFSLGRWITGGATNPDGTVLALRTYTEVYFYRWPLTPEPVEAGPVCALGLIEPVGEAIAYSPEGGLYLTSESLGRMAGHLLEIEC